MTILLRSISMGAVAIAALACADAAVAQTRAFDIPAQDATRSIPEFGRQAGLQIIVSGATLRGLRTPAVKGNLDAREALRRLLGGTDLVITSDDGRVVTLGKQQSSGLKTSSSVDPAIIVTGSRLQNRKAIAERASRVQVTDSVTSDDVDQLPDFNIGDALERLPGIAIEFDQAEARFVTVRALNAAYNHTTIDGVSVAVPDANGRRVYMDVMPASLADKVNVYKTFTANMDAGGIGGLIDIRTASAFDRKKNHLRLSAEIGKYENDEGFRGDAGPSGTANFAYSTKFGDSDQFGILVFANYYKRHSYINQADSGSRRYFYDENGKSVGQPTEEGVYPGTGLPVPEERRWFSYLNNRTRYGGGTKLEYKTDRDYLFFRGFWNTATDDEGRLRDVWNHAGGGTLTNQTPDSGELRGATNRANLQTLGWFDFERTVWGLTGGGEHELGNERTDISWRANYSGSTFSNYENWLEWRSRNTSASDFRYERNGDSYAFIPLNPDQYNDLSRYSAIHQKFDSRELEENIYEGKLDIGHDLGEPGSGWRIEGGAAIRRIERGYDENQFRYLPNSGNTYNLEASGAVIPGLCTRPPGALKDQPGQCIVATDYKVGYQSFTDHLAANPGQWRYDEMVEADNELDYALNETVIAAYGQVRHQGEAFELAAGMRFESTRNTGRGLREVDGTWQPTRNKGGYEDFLPSVNASYKLTDNHVVRAAFSKTLGRVPFNAIAPVGERLSFDDEDGTTSLTRSNPNLKPRRSTNADVAFDWYFPGRRGLLSASLFYKNVKNEFFTLTQDETIDIDGVPTLVSVRQPVNAGAPIDIYGLELNLVRELDFILPEFLSGFTLSANATFLETNFKQLMGNGSEAKLRTMIGQPRIAYNAVLSYDRGPFGIRVAYNRVGERLRSVNTDTTYRMRYHGPRESLGVKARYNINKAFAVTFAATNLTNDTRTEFIGWDREIAMVEADAGRAFLFGVVFRP